MKVILESTQQQQNHGNERSVKKFWKKVNRRIRAKLTHRCWRNLRAFVSWARRWDQRWIAASAPFLGG